MVAFEPVWIVYGLVGLGALLLIVRFGKQLLRAVLFVVGAAVIITIALALLQQSRATQQTATAATLATTGQTASSLGQTILVSVLLLVLLGGAGLSGYLYLRLRRAERGSFPLRQRSPTTWPLVNASRPTCTPEPEARWQHQPTPSDVGATVHSLVQLEVLRTLRELRAPAQPRPPTLPAGEDKTYAYESEDNGPYWGW
jgi:hypothetical protein